MSQSKPRHKTVAISIAIIASFALGWAAAKSSYPPLDLLLSSGQTIIDQQVAYPAGTAKVTAAIVTLERGAETGWHHHEVPLFAYILEGGLTVDYGEDGERAFGPGDSFLEAFKSAHNGRNDGTDPVRILAVFAGAENTPNTVMGK